MSNTIYKLTHEDILDKNILDHYIYPNMEQNYYYSKEFDEKFYIDLALKGFITIWYKEEDQEYLLPEIQREYAILDFKDLHISKKVQKLLKKDTYQFFHNSDFEEVIRVISGFHQNSWMQGKYIELLKKLIHCEYKKSFFSLSVFGIKDKLSGKIVAAEIGYSTYHNSIYTSLSGFCLRKKQYNHYGNLQMVLLAHYLENNNYKFWNLGHPYMEYKLQLGSKVLPRIKFLERLKKLAISKQLA
jgi:Leu/Phe-tRNA-protein transferase